VDTFTLVKTLGEQIGYSTQDAETVMGIISTWGSKFNMIIISISTGVIISLIPNLTSSLVLDDKKDIHRKINQTFQILIFLTIPMTVGLSFLAEPVWMVFYGRSEYGPSVLSYFVFVALITSLFTTSVTMVQVLKYYKVVFFSLATGVLLKALLNVSLICGFHKMGLPAYYGSITATMIGYGVSFIICLMALHKKCGVNYEETVKQLVHVLCGTVLMILVLLVLKLVVPIVVSNRFLNIFIIMIYALVGMVVYFLFTWKMHTIQDIFGDNLLKKLRNRKKKGARA